MSERHFGFRNKRSKVGTFAKRIEHIKLIPDFFKETCSVLLDLTKTFDNVEHNLLLLKCFRKIDLCPPNFFLAQHNTMCERHFGFRKKKKYK